MKFQPKTRKYKYSFRNKTRVEKKGRVLRYQNRQTLKNFGGMSNQDQSKGPASFFKKNQNINAFTLPYIAFEKPENAFKTLKLWGKPLWEKPGHLKVDQCRQTECNYHFALKTEKGLFVAEATLQDFQNQFKIYKNGKNVLKTSLSLSPVFNFGTYSRKSQGQSKLPATYQNNAALSKVSFGSCGIYFCSSGTVSAKFLETVRLEVARKLKKSGRFWIRICADTPVTARSAETRMGRGKGAFSHYEAKVKPGQMFLEFSGLPMETIKFIFKALSKKTPVPVKMLY